MELYVDGHCNNKLDSYGLSSVTDNKGTNLILFYEELFPDLTLQNINTPKGMQKLAVIKFNDVKMQQNNGAELIALIMALRIAHYIRKSNDIPIIIYSDSQLIVKYWSIGRVNNKERMDPIKLKYIMEAIQLRSDDKNIKVELISGDKNIADIGYHK